MPKYDFVSLLFQLSNNGIVAGRSTAVTHASSKFVRPIAQPIGVFGKKATARLVPAINIPALMHVMAALWICPSVTSPVIRLGARK